LIANTNQANTDGDAQGDACDPDDDNDTVDDGTDNCQLVANTDQTNTDGDAQGDACDPDDDNDNVNDGSDNCPASPNAGQEDVDSDGIGDACDPTDDRPGPGPVPAPNAEPETTIGHFPKNPKRDHTHFRFRSSIAGSTFTCQIDKKEPEPCRSPMDYRVLDAGRHVFKVFAASPQGVDDPTPAKARFRVQKPSR
jgi:hypothetical protein